MSIKDLIIKDALAARAAYDELERNVGGLGVVRALRLREQIDQAAERYGPLNLAMDKIAPPFTGREALFQALEQVQAEATGVEALRQALGAIDGRFSLRELQRQASELQTLGELACANLAFEHSFAGALKSISITLPVETLWHNVSKVAEPWISLDNPYRSFEAFGALSELASLCTVTSDDEAEVDSRIDELPAPAIRPLGRAAGLKIHGVEARVDQGSSPNIGILLVGTSTWGMEAHVQIKGIEIMLRVRLDEHMTGRLGPDWHKHRVSKAVLEVWRSRQTEARVGCSDNLLDFATFGELRDILLRGDVWPTFSTGVGMTKEEFVILLDHLMEIRHAVDHARPLMRRHFVWCFADVDRILQAFGFEAPDEY